MKSDLPLISVIIPVYNAEVFLEEALLSIQKQAYEPLEIIVVDDGSTDKTAEIATSFSDNVRYVDQENSGPALARNKGLRMAQGEIIAFLDADDLWPNNKIEIQLAYFIKNPLLEIVVGRVQYLLLSEIIYNKKTFKEFAQPSVGVNLGAGLYRKSVFEKLGYFDPALRLSEDVDLFMRIRENGISMAMIEAVTLYYRIHENNISRERERQHALFIKALKQSLNRRRQSEGTASSLPSLFYINEKLSSSNSLPLTEYLEYK